MIYCTQIVSNKQYYNFYSVKPTLAAGGCAQNTLRILQWLLDQTNSMKFCLYSGCLGKDSRGIALQEIVEASGVQTR